MTPIEYFKLKKQLGEVGIEIEVEGQYLYNNKMKYWKAIRDGSLRGNESMEYVLINPVKRKEIIKTLKFLKKTFKDNRSIIDEDSPRTSVHVHVNVQDISFENIINYFCLYSIFETLLVHFCGVNREGNLFCLRLQDADDLIERLVFIIRGQSWSNLNTQIIRYASINLAAIPKYGSIEFRAMRGTVNIKLIQDWIFMLLRLKDMALTFEKSSDIMAMFSQNNEQEFLNHIMGEYAKRLNMPDMKKHIRAGARRIQEVAYTNSIEKEKKVIKKPLQYEGQFIGQILQGVLDDPGREAFQGLHFNRVGRVVMEEQNE